MNRAIEQLEKQSRNKKRLYFVRCKAPNPPVKDGYFFDKP